MIDMGMKVLYNKNEIIVGKAVEGGAIKAGLYLEMPLTNDIYKHSATHYEFTASLDNQSEAEEFAYAIEKCNSELIKIKLYDKPDTIQINVHININARYLNKVDKFGSPIYYNTKYGKLVLHKTKGIRTLTIELLSNNLM